MKIAIIASLDFPINEHFAGGLENFIFNLSKTLVEKGQDVTVFCCGGSNIPGVKTEIIIEEGAKVRLSQNLEQEEESRKIAYSANKKMMSDLVKGKYNFDVYHINSTHYLTVANQDENFAKHSLVTLHLPVTSMIVEESKKTLGNKIKMINYIAISDFQKMQAPELNFFGRVYNGIDINEFTFQDKGKGCIGWLGRISPDKGIDLAIQMAIENKWSFSFAGKQHYKVFFDEKIKPFISNNVEYLGEIFGKEKSDFYGSCAVFVAPIQWDEPFGLTIVESMACGTPVVAFNRGAMSELIIDGVTGYLVEPGDNAGFALAVEKAKLLDRKKCREHVENNFSIEKMVGEYLALYQKIIKDNAKN